MILPLTVKDQSVETSGITKDYRDAICEFIWNGFEANATEVRISYTESDLTSIESITISDNGDGITYDDISETFGTFLASKKNTLSLRLKSKANKGKGRFSFASFAHSAIWETVYKDIDAYKSFTITLKNDNKELAYYSDPVKSNKNGTGTIVTFFNIYNLFSENLNLAYLEDVLLKEFAWFLYLNKNKKYKIIVNDKVLDYSKYINLDLSKDIQVTIGNYEFKINLIVWQDKINEKFCCYYFDSNDAVKGKDTTTFNRNTVNFNHSIFVSSHFFDNLDDVSIIHISDQQNFFLSDEEQKNFKSLNQYIQRFIEENLAKYMSSKADEEIDKMINIRKTFPKFSDEPYDQIRKNDLINITKELYCLDSRIFYKLKDIQEKSLLGFLNLLLNSEERENILDIIEQIVDLTAEQRKNFSDILKKTHLENIIETMHFIEARYKVIEILKLLVYNFDKFTNERDNIQKIIEHHYWLFGEQYNLVSADYSMKTALEKYNYLLYGSRSPKAQLEPDVENERRMDIFLCGVRKVENSFGNFLDENVIVELKSPKVTLSKTVLRQVEDYMDFIRRQSAFNSILCRWKFIAVSKTIDDEVKARYKTFESNGKPGLVSMIENYEVYAFTWADLFKKFELSHDFVLDKLKFDKDKIINELLKEKNDENKEMVEELTKKAINL